MPTRQQRKQKIAAVINGLAALVVLALCLVWFLFYVQTYASRIYDYIFGPMMGVNP